jgi:3-oxoacyl-[acyl-carrier protein] reductase
MDRKIWVNAVAPGTIGTERLMQITSSEEMKIKLLQQPTGALGRPEDIANAVAFLASSGTEFLTGQVLLVDGGKSLGFGLGM